MSEFESHPSSDPSSMQVQKFIDAVRRRLNRRAWWHSLWISLTAGGGVLLVIAVAYVIAGQQVPWPWYPAVLAVTAMVALTMWFRRRVSSEQAARFADRHFDLKDTVRSCHNFSLRGLNMGLYALQSTQAGRQVQKQPLEQIGFRPPPGLVAAALLVILLAVGLAFKGPSPTIVAQAQLRQATLETTDQINQQLNQWIDELDLAVTEQDERELINPNQLKEWVQELASTGDPREAMRQYAKLERKIQQAADALQTRRDEQLLDRAAAELRKDAPNRDLADLLKQKKYEQAADEMDKLRPESRERKPGLKLSERQKELARLRAAAQRMASVAEQKAARQQGQAMRDGQANRGRRAAADRDPSGRPSQANDQDAQDAANDRELEEQDGQEAGDPDGDQDGDRDEDEGELAELLADLDEAVRQWEEALERLQLEQNLDGLDDELEDGECEACRAAVDDQLRELGQRLRALGKKRAAAGRLKGLAQRFSQAQTQLSSRNSNAQVGGREAGRGTSDRQRLDQDNPETKSYRSALKGIHGEGPSLSQIQAADSGSGVSGRRGQAVERDFQRQFESFVEREDIPEDLKSGVKSYFLHIHQIEEAAGAAPDNESDNSLD